jgi:purine-binding chemotaxis protein CheW
VQELLTLVEIQLGRDHYLIDSNIIDKFILPLQTVEVYDAPPYIDGMVEWKQEMIPAINVAPLLGMEKAAESNRRRTMIVPAGRVMDTPMAVSVDEVCRIRKVQSTEVMPVDISACHGIEDYVKGIIRVVEESEGDTEQMVLLYLNLEKMMRELLKGKVARPTPGFYVWRWDTVLTALSG